MSLGLPELVRLALAEDLGPGDITSEATVPAGTRARGRVVAKQPLVVAGQAAAAEVFRQTGASWEVLVPDGLPARPGQDIARVHGRARALLSGERLALNFLMHLSGIATHTAQVVSALPEGSKMRVVDTRKTTPLLRVLERRAVRSGGGGNHRHALYDGILIKDNHIVAAGGIGPAVAGARRQAHHLVRVEVEVEDLDQVAQALTAGADVLMLDNMDDGQVAAAIERIGGRALVEVSGNITADRLATLSRLGVDLVSMGGLIHQARWADLSLKFDLISP